tara:strand:+ start:1576 stop:1785 length:210 start_codon:yes stop_codon:yes gene_type:complete
MPMKKDRSLLKKYQNGITISDTIEMYENMIEDPAYKHCTKNSAINTRLTELRILYRTGMRHFPRQKKYK